MNTKVYLFIAFRIVFLFSIAMASTFLPEHLRGFFGDINIPKRSGFGIDTDWTWGARHYWFFWMMFMLFALSLVDAIVGIVSKINKHYPNL